MFLDTSDANRLRGANSLAGITSDFQKQMNDLIAPPDQGDAASGMLTAGGPSVSLPSEPAAAPAATAPPAVSPTSPLPDPSQATDTRFQSNDPTEAYVRQSAAKRGIDPDTAVKVYRSEGAGAYVGDNGSSFGPFQLHYGNVAGGGNAVAGLGDEFTRRTGLDARDPKTVNQQIDFALDQVKSQGWTPFHGAARVGVGAQDGIGAVNTELAKDNPDWYKVATAQMGKPYIWGSAGGRSDFSDSAAGFDCSGFVSYVYKNALGINLPAQTESAYAATKAVDPKDAQPGDVVLYNMDNPDPHVQHIAIYVGDGKVIQAGGSANTRNVNIAPIATAGTYQFRRADGANTTQANTQATASVADKAQDAAAQPKSLTDYGSDFAAQLGGLVSGAGQAKDQVVDHVANAADDFQKQLGSLISGAGLAPTGQEGVTQGPSGETPPDYNAVKDTLAGAGSVMQQGQDVNVAGDVAANAARRENFPNITEPNHPFNVMSDMAAKYPSKTGLVDLEAMTPEDRNSYLNAYAAVGGVEMPTPPESNGARPLFGRGGVPGGARKEIPAAAGDTQDLLQQMLDMAKQKKGSDDATVQAVQSQLDKMRAPVQPAEDTVRAAVDEVRRQGGDPKTLQTIQDGLDDLARTREIPNGPQAGQLGLEDQRFPYNPTIPSGVNEASGAAGRDVAGQLTFDSPLPNGGPRPNAGEVTPGGVQPGQLGFEDPRFPVARPINAGANETRGPIGLESPQQMRLPGDDPLYGTVGGDMSTRTGASSIGAREIPNGIQQGQMPLDGFPKGTTKVTQGELFNAYHSGNVISGLGTATHVAVNSIIAPVWSAATRTGADLATLRFDRIAGRSIGATSALVNIGRDFADAFAEHYGSMHNIANRVDNPLVSKALQVQQLPGSALHASFQNTARSAVTRLEYGALAGEQASKEGLAGRAWASRVSELINDPSQLKNAASAQDVGQRAALQAPAGTVQQALQKIARIPVIGNTLFPVVRISAQSLAQGIEKSPLGLIGTGVDVARGMKGVGPYAKGYNQLGGAVTPLGDRLTNNIAGTAFTAFMAQKAMEGTITGEGPNDPNDRAILVGQGWQPHSIYVPGRGYVDYHMMGALAVPLAMAGAYSDAQLYHSHDDAVGKAWVMTRSIGSYLENSTGLSTLGDLSAILRNGQGADAVASSFIGNTAGGFVPESGLVRSTAQATDSSARKPNLKAEPGETSLQQITRGAGEVVKQNIPGLRETVSPAQDVIGRTMQNPAAGAGALVPNTGKGTPSATLRVLGETGQTIPPAPSTITVKGVPVELSNEDRQYYERERGVLLQATIPAIDDSLKGLSPDARRQVLLKLLPALITNADDAARNATLVRVTSSGQLLPRIATSLTTKDQRRAPLPAVKQP